MTGMVQIENVHGAEGSANRSPLLPLTAMLALAHQQNPTESDSIRLNPTKSNHVKYSGGVSVLGTTPKSRNQACSSRIKAQKLKIREALLNAK
jgi:hypothetical protein